MSTMKAHIQINLQSKRVVEVINKLGRNKRIFIEQALIEYINKLEDENRLDIYISNSVESKKVVKKDKDVKVEKEVIKDVEEHKETKYSFDY